MTTQQHNNINVDALTRADYGSYYGIYIDLVPKGMSLAEALDPKNAPLIDLASGLTEEQSLLRSGIWDKSYSSRAVVTHRTSPDFPCAF